MQLLPSVINYTGNLNKHFHITKLTVAQISNILIGIFNYFFLRKKLIIILLLLMV